MTRRMTILSGARVAGLLGVAAAGGAARAADPWPAGARVYLIAPKDGEVVTGPVKVVMGLSGLGVAPAGVDKPNTGHHHILVDAPAPSGADLDAPMPANDHIRHFGGGQTETSLTLPAGTHTLQLIVGDMNHIPHSAPLVSEIVTITVQ
jgi:hypothetical protein